MNPSQATVCRGICTTVPEHASGCPGRIRLCVFSYWALLMQSLAHPAFWQAGNVAVKPRSLSENSRFRTRDAPATESPPPLSTHAITFHHENKKDNK